MTVTTVPIESIDHPDPVLRRFREDSVGFLELVTQIKEQGGCLQAPPARPRPLGRVQLCDGYRRYRAHIIAGVETMHLNIMEMDDAEYLRNQMLCNAMYEDTDWIDYARHLDRLRNLGDSEMSLSELSEICNRSTTWVRKVLQLNHLLPRFAEMVRRNELPISNAKCLARIPRSEQMRFIDDARTMRSKDFEAATIRVLNDYREQLKDGKLALIGVDHLKPNMRNLQVIEEEINSPSHLPILIAMLGVTDPMAAANLALKWAFRVDDASIEERREKMLKVECQRINDATRRKEDREMMRYQEQSKTVT